MTDPALAISSAPASTSSVRVLFFGPVRVQLGIAETDLAYPGETTALAFWEQLIVRFPELKPMRITIRLARGGEFLTSSDPVRPGDEIALIPPVSGG